MKTYALFVGLALGICLLGAAPPDAKPVTEVTLKAQDFVGVMCTIAGTLAYKIDGDHATQTIVVTWRCTAPRVTNMDAAMARSWKQTWQRTQLTEAQSKATELLRVFTQKLQWTVRRDSIRIENPATGT